jgi:KaiC/GvpD/RAD55 family RecA-like ATPase
MAIENEPLVAAADRHGWEAMRDSLIKRFEDVRDEMARGGWTALCPCCPLNDVQRFFISRSLNLEACAAGHDPTLILAKVLSDQPASAPPTEPLSVNVSDFFDSCDQEIIWLFEPYLFAGGFTLVQGAPKSGKTWFVAYCAVRVALDAHHVLFVEEEGAREVLRDRLKPFIRNMAEINEFLHISFRKRFRLDSQESVDSLIDEIRRTNARLLVLDPFIGLHGKREKESDEMSIILNAIQDIIAATGCAVLLVHHTRKGESWNKSSNADASSEDARGSGALVGSVDTVIAVKGLPAAKRVDGEVRMYLENPDTRVGAPFAKRLVCFRLSDGQVLEMEPATGPEKTPEDLLGELLLALPYVPQHKPRHIIRSVMKVNKSRLDEAVSLGISRGLIEELPNKGIGRVDSSPRKPESTGSTQSTGIGRVDSHGLYRDHESSRSMRVQRVDSLKTLKDQEDD